MNDSTRRVFLNEWVWASVVSIVTFIGYLTTVSPTVSFIDAGELATVAALLGIAHPTGYPLFSLVAHTALLVPAGGEEIFRLNVFCSVVVALSVGLFFRTLLVIERLLHENRARERGSSAPPAGIVVMIVSAIASWSFGFSTTVWAQSVAIEVYGLHLLLLGITIFYFLRGIEDQSTDPSAIPRRLFAAAFFLGLSFSNHLTTLLIVPALLYLYFATYGWERGSLRRALKFVPLFAVGLSPYLYLPIRSHAHPPLEWGYPAEVERILWHVSGKQYRNWMFSSFDSAEKQLTYFVNHFASEYNIVLLALALLGAWFLFRSGRKIFWFLIVAFAGCLAYSINYDIHDIDSYFLLAYFVTGVFLFAGIIRLIGLIPYSTSPRLLPLTFLVLLSLPVSQFVSNRRQVSEADNYLVADYVHNVFSNAEKNALILTYQWDYFVAGSFYYQYVRHEREDLVVVDKELLRRSWYFIYLKDRFPWLIERSKGEVEDFLAELYKFEHDLPYDGNVIESRYVRMINSFIERSYADRPVYVGPEIEPEMGAGYTRLASGLLFRLSQGVDRQQLNPIKIDYRPTLFEDRLTIGLRGICARMLTLTASRYLAESQPANAKMCVDKALAVDPTYAAARTLREQIAKAGRLGNE